MVSHGIPQDRKKLQILYQILPSRSDKNIQAQWPCNTTEADILVNGMMMIQINGKNKYEEEYTADDDEEEREEST